MLRTFFVAYFKAQQEALNQFAGTASGRGLFLMPPRCIFATPFPLDFYCLFSVEAVKLCVCVGVCVRNGKTPTFKIVVEIV